MGAVRPQALHRSPRQAFGVQRQLFFPIQRQL
jgi:hypothetical protein